jgi:hypothetical protein
MSKTFHFGPNEEQVLDHLCLCPTCLSRVTAALWAIPAGEAAKLIYDVRRCLRATLIMERAVLPLPK